MRASAGRRTLRALPACLLAAALSAPGCAIGVREDLLGFPDVRSDTPSGTADRAHEAVRRTERAILEAPLEGDEGGWRRAAILRLMDAYVALSNDEVGPSSGWDPQGTLTRRPPLHLYPRATCPLVVEGTEAPDGGREWIFPVILNRRAFEVRRTAEVWLGYPLAALLFPAVEHELPQAGPPLYEELQRHLRFVLVPRDREHPAEITVDAGPDRFLPTRAVLGRGEGPDLLRLREDAIEILFRLPSSEVEQRWSALARARGGGEVQEELFDLRIFPRLALDPGSATEPWRPVARALAEGRWPTALARMRDLVVAGGPGPSARDALALAAAADAFGGSFHRFAGTVDLLAAPARALARDPSSAVARTALLQGLDRAIREDDCPAPVLLDRPDPADRSFSFIACGDLQYHANGSKLFAFLSMVDPEGAPRDAPGPIPSPALPPEVAREVRAAKFIVLVGDFGDGEGFSSSGISPALDGLGLNTPRSPYRDLDDPAVGEFPELREQVRRSSKALFAVPGNHDGFASYGGILNQTAAGLGYLLQALPLTSVVGTWLTDSASHRLPILGRIARVTPPFYDGLVDWSYELGPRNVAFHYRGMAFVAVNSVDLLQADRDQVGALANNWGGTLQDISLAWADLALRHFGSLDRRSRRLPPAPGPGRTFFFIHHDPRGAIASKNGFVERHFGAYHTIVAPLNELTLGYLGTHTNRYTGVFLPVITPLAGHLIAASGEGENFHQRWMRETVWDGDAGNARGLIEVVNRNLAGAPEVVPEGGGAPCRPAGISHVFMGHDDVPIVSDWIHPPGGSVFPDAPDLGASGFREGLEGVFRRPTHEGTPDWGAGMLFQDGRRATVVRMDDLGDAHDRSNTHGFHLVTVTFPGPGAPPTEPPQVKVRWIQVPR